MPRKMAKARARWNCSPSQMPLGTGVNDDNSATADQVETRGALFAALRQPQAVWECLQRFEHACLGRLIRFGRSAQSIPRTLNAIGVSRADIEGLDEVGRARSAE